MPVIVLVLVPWHAAGRGVRPVGGIAILAAMPVMISMLRGVNLGPHNRIKMDALRALYESLKLEDASSYVQSGNVIFWTREKNATALAKKIQDAIHRNFAATSSRVSCWSRFSSATRGRNPA